MQQQAQENQDAATVLKDLMNAGVVRQESEHTFVAVNEEGERRFDYSQD